MKKIILILVICIFNLSFSQTSDKKLPGVITTQAYYMGSSNGCNTMWVGVFSTTDNTTLLIASGVVQVGDGCPRISTSNNLNCNDEILNGDYITNSMSKIHNYCLIDCLKIDEVYDLFKKDKIRILSSRN